VIPVCTSAKKGEDLRKGLWVGMWPYVSRTTGAATGVRMEPAKIDLRDRPKKIGLKRSMRSYFQRLVVRDRLLELIGRNGEIDRNIRLRLYRFRTLVVGSEPPLPNRIFGGGSQDLWSAYHAQILNHAVAANQSLQNY
jgi:hypothetical protein